tara:strand:+ start:61 stop:294 length:234 start_codon:yes stop_codon:yes gene_type:complete
MTDSHFLILMGCFVLGWLQFATVLIAYSATKAKSRSLGLLGFLVWLIVVFVVAVVVIDQFIVLPWLDLTNYYICGGQ